MTDYIKLENGVMILFTNPDAIQSHREFVHNAFTKCYYFEDQAWLKQDLMSEGTVHEP